MSVEVLPKDAHNAELVANVHPLDWRPPSPAPRYNLVVIGAGTAGLVTAAGAAGLGAKVALVEKFLMGGDCLNVGCVPSKAVIRCGRAVFDAKEAGPFGVRVGSPIQVDFPAVMERMRKLRADLSPHDSAVVSLRAAEQVRGARAPRLHHVEPPVLSTRTLCAPPR